MRDNCLFLRHLLVLYLIWFSNCFYFNLQSYASILYLRLPPGFRIILRGKDVEHHNVVNDMMMTQEVTYRPQPSADGVPKDLNMVAVVTIGFVKDAKHHIDVQDLMSITRIDLLRLAPGAWGCSWVLQLLEPFWRLWNAAGSDGRGVIGVLEANFVEPAHDKQGFERTIVLSRLETRLLQMQKTYWTTYCHKIGYAPRRNKKLINESARETSPDYLPQTPSQPKKKVGASSGKTPLSNLDKHASHSNHKQGGRELERTPETVYQSHGNGHASSKQEKRTHMPTRPRKEQSSLVPSSPSAEDVDDDDVPAVLPEREANGRVHKASHANNSFGKDGHQISTRSQSKGDDVNGNSNSLVLEQLREENCELKERLKRKEGDTVVALRGDLEKEREKCKLLETELQEARQKIEDMNKEQDSLIDIFSEERDRRDIEEENLRKKLREASNTIQELLERVRVLEKMKTPNGKSERR
ncbi:Protein MICRORCHIDIA 4 [Vitis vinifera]|uniref:Protein MICRORCHIDIA 4 n=1 Tax=Vitis vinifera TaxID=29760 RepID=A0A438EXZ2_VITVI|nr:Protein MICRORCHIDIA 4 [Vitis vinifera]